MPPLHVLIKRILLTGVPLPDGARPGMAPPVRLQALLAACAATHRSINAMAVRYGNRYRSAYWSVYLLSSVAVLFAALPPALGWDLERHSLHSYAWAWGLCELLVIMIVGVVYWRGHHADWQGQWLAARTHAELAWYLPLIAPLVDFNQPHPEASWYARVFAPGQHVREADGVGSMCTDMEPLARSGLDGAWEDEAFVTSYARWAIHILDGQRLYHLRVRAEHHALHHRVHRITGALFAFTALGAVAHLVLHSLWLSVLAVFFPALAAALHGALAQTEAYRLEQSATRLVASMEHATAGVEQALQYTAASGDTAPLAAAVQEAVAVILDEHQDWHGTVRPHHIPLG